MKDRRNRNNNHGTFSTNTINANNTRWKSHCVSLEMDSRRPWTETDLDHFVRQIESALRDYKGACLSDCRFLFHSRVASTHSNNKKSTTSSLQRALQEVQASTAVPNLFAASSNQASTSPLQEEVDRLRIEREELKTQLRESGSEVDRWKATCREQEDRIQILASLLDEASGQGSLECGEMDPNAAEKGGVSRTPLANGLTCFPQNGARRRPKNNRISANRTLEEDQQGKETKNELLQTKKELQELKLTGKDQSIQWQRQSDELKSKLLEANRDVKDWMATLQEQQKRIETLEAEAKSLPKQVQTLEETLRQVQDQKETLLGEIQCLRAERDQSLEQLHRQEAGLQSAAAGSLMEETMDLNGNATSGPQELQAIMGANHNHCDAQLLETCRHQLKACQLEVEELQSKLENRDDVIAADRGAVAELEGFIATQQLQIESLSVVNREQRLRLQGLAADNKSVDSGSLATTCLESSGTTTEDKEDWETVEEVPLLQLEALENIWDEQRTQVFTIQRDQDALFRKLGQKSSDATTKIDKLCDSIGKLPKEEGAEPDEDCKNSDVPIHANKLLGVIYEGGETDASTCDLEAVIEQLELAWMQQTEEIEALQRDQNALLNRLRVSSLDAHEPSRQCRSEQEEVRESVEGDLQRQNDLLTTVQSDNKQLLQKLREAERRFSSEIVDLPKQSGALSTINEELHVTCKRQLSTSDKLKEEQVSLLRASEEPRDRWTEMEDSCEKQRSSISQIEEEKRTRAGEIETQSQLLAQLRETIDCFRGERKILERALDDSKTRAKELDGVCAFQKTTISGLQAEKDSLVKRLLDTERDLTSNGRFFHPTKAVAVDSSRQGSIQTATTVATSFEGEDTEEAVFHTTRDDDRDDAEHVASDKTRAAVPSTKEQAASWPKGSGRVSGSEMTAQDVLHLLSFGII